MIYHITDAHDTIVTLRDNPTGLIVFDLEPEVYPSDIAIACKECTECKIVHVFDLSDEDKKYCHCGGYLDGSYVDLVIQNDKVLFALHRMSYV